MFTFFKSNIASLLASLCDYATTILFVQLLHFNPVVGSIIGTILGGTINFFIGRHFVFIYHKDKLNLQAIRYTAVWCGYLILSAAVLYMLTISGMTYLMAKLFSSLVIFACYNYPLQKYFVFNNPKNEAR